MTISLLINGAYTDSYTGGTALKILYAASWVLSEVKTILQSGYGRYAGCIFFNYTLVRLKLQCLPAPLADAGRARLNRRVCPAVETLWSKWS